LKGSLIVEIGKQVPALYFNYRNGIRITNPFLGLNISDLPEQSYFGDYQILLGFSSQYDYTATDEGHEHVHQTDNTWCMTIGAALFSNFCSMFPAFRSFLMNRGLQRRSFLRQTEENLIATLNLQPENAKLQEAYATQYDQLMKEKPYFISN
jgi:hypothetical protein